MNAIKKRILWESFRNQLWYLNRSCFCCWHGCRHHWCSNGSALQATKHFSLRPFKSCAHKSRGLAINWEKHPPCFVSAKPPGAGAASQSGIQCFSSAKKILLSFGVLGKVLKNTQSIFKRCFHHQIAWTARLDFWSSMHQLPCMISPNLMKGLTTTPLDPCVPWPQEALSCKNLIQGSAVGSAGFQLRSTEVVGNKTQE